ncbi:MULTISPECIES: SGNH/GDSL hydrolase family protein [Trichocoleus]|uniref:SGNH/GDSL hydrolase family protein n=1 Tax=Trichocoleus desertorum GB2-A4 TaxID=2933944 RepID=A0ABV0J2R7_9CYAN|nr:SGNH/GDSL hydrolase family protein [Trichocoleus sp. FACHB-46]MBD1860687.1 SGNH/GDSL hydrolase family protein [Trichocoleus sp. FACHB-46]
MFRPSRRSAYRKQRRLSWPLITLLTLPLVLIVLEFLVRTFVGVTGQSNELAAYQGKPTKATAYGLRFLDASQQPYDGLPIAGQLAAKPSLATGYKLVGKQQSQFWRINEQGFRSDRPVPVAKPKGETRIFLLGGSTAFGQMSSTNQTTFAHKLEASLNQQVAQQKRNPEKFRPDVLPYYKEEVDKALTLPPRIRDGQYRVINAAVPGYASGNEVAQLAMQVLTYQPDIIVVVDGYRDLLLPSTEEGVTIPGAEALLEDAPRHFYTHLTQQLSNLFTQSYLVKGIQYWLIKPQPSVDELSLVAANNNAPLVEQLPSEPTEVERRAERYRSHLQQMARLATAAKIPLIVAVQPEVTSRTGKNRSSEEAKIQQALGATYSQRVKAGYTEIEQAALQVQKEFPKTVTTLNLYNLYNNFPSQAFVDTVHLTDEANTVLAKRLYGTIAKLLNVPVQPNPSPY